MTAEIAVMNKEAVAMAADSAVTAGSKVFTSADKIFVLSHQPPVGVMIHGNASFMQIPWETLIKIYKNQISKKKFKLVKKYGNDFIKFLRRNTQLFPQSIQKDEFIDRIKIFYEMVFKEIREEVKKESKKSSFSREQISSLVASIINDHYLYWKRTNPISGIPKNYVNNLRRKYITDIVDIINDMFGKFHLDKKTSNQLIQIALSLPVKFPKRVRYSGSSGIVLAGFGTEEIFPALQVFSIDGMLDNFLKCEVEPYQQITFENPASIAAFAQREMVYAFMEGIDLNYETVIYDFINEIFELYPNLIIESIGAINTSEKRKLKKKVIKIGIDKLRDGYQKLGEYQMRKFRQPVLGTVAFLPKAELAAFAESLVNLTSFKRKMSPGQETVHEPIDVAVISKVDGFVWIKKKLYFDKELNPRLI